MKRTTNNDIIEALGRQPSGSHLRPADDFWTEFRARAGMRAQDSVDVGAPRATLTWVAPLACAATLLVAAGLYMFSVPPAAAGQDIKSIEVIASHSAVLIMQDEETETTVLWVAGMEPDAPGKDNK